MSLTCQALVLNEPAAIRLRIETVTVPALQTGEVRVRMLAAALNHRDEWIRQGLYAGIQYPAILGSDGCGIVEEAADDTGRHWLGQEVIINPNNDWGPNPAVQGSAYTIRGLQTAGTFAQYLVLPAHRLHAKPAHLSPQQAAALPLAGLTAYRATVHYGKPKPGMRVLVTGIGGGVAMFALQFALALGAACWVTTGDERKLKHAVSLGAKGGANYKTPDYWKAFKKETGGFDLIVDSAGGDSLNSLIELCRPAGQIVFYGATTGVPKQLNIRKMFWNQTRLQGSTMGSDDDFTAMVALVNQHKIVPVVDGVRPFAQILDALADMRAHKQLGKLVVGF